MEQQDNGIDGDYTHQKYYKYTDAITPFSEKIPKKLQTDSMCKFINKFYSGYKIFNINYF